MTDSDKELHKRPVPMPEPDPLVDEDDKQANQLAIGFALFIPIGIVLGLLVFDNIGLGVAIGLGAGSIYSIAVGRARN